VKGQRPHWDRLDTLTVAVAAAVIAAAALVLALTERCAR
jgi:hypothetical protein